MVDATPVDTKVEVSLNARYSKAIVALSEMLKIVGEEIIREKYKNQVDVRDIKLARLTGQHKLVSTNLLIGETKNAKD